jgi:hypothetical protein
MTRARAGGYGDGVVDDAVGSKTEAGAQSRPEIMDQEAGQHDGGGQQRDRKPVCRRWHEGSP